jgi:NAD-dependent dihydropyrimidine dehydrogenase PreA subunit
MKKTIITIDNELCIGCGACVNRCKQDALQLVDGKATLINDNYCDGLGHCIGECPVGAITLIERETEPTAAPMACGCPGTMAREIERPESSSCSCSSTSQPSELRQFPVQLHLVSPQAGFFRGADLLLAADCSAFACGDFHGKFLKGKMLAIACPKLDGNTQVYADKLVEMIDGAKINTLTVLVMEVPCCGGLVRLAQAARERAQRNVPVKVITLSVGGEVLSEEWI